MSKLSRAALLGVVVQQARKFVQTPRGQQVMAQVKATATDPAARAQLLNQVKAAATDPSARQQLLQQAKAVGRGGSFTGQPGAYDPHPPSTQPLAPPVSVPTSPAQVSMPPSPAQVSTPAGPAAASPRPIPPA